MLSGADDMSVFASGMVDLDGVEVVEGGRKEGQFVGDCRVELDCMGMSDCEGKLFDGDSVR